MAALGDLVVNLTADTRRFQSGLGKGRKMLGSFVGGITRTIGKVGALGGAVAGLAGAGSLGLLIKQGQESTLQLGKLSDQTGESVKQLSRLQFAADQLRIDRGDLSGAIEELNIRLGETIRDGAGPAAEALDRLNLRAERLSQLPVSQRIGAIADALQNVQNASTRAFLADEIFGGDAFRIMGLLRQGSEGINRMGNEAERLGAVLDNIDVAQVRASAQATGRLKTIFTGVSRQLAVQLAPFIEAVAEKFLSMAKKGFDAGEFVASGMEIAAKGIGVVADLIFAWRTQFKLTQSAVTAGIGVIVKGLAVLGKGIEAVLNLLPGVKVQFSDTLDAMGDDLLKLSKDQFGEFRDRANTLLGDGALPSEKIERFFNDIKQRSRESARQLAEASQGSNPASQLAEDAIEAKARMNELKSIAKTVMRETRTPLQEFRQEVEKLRELKGDGLIDRETFGRAFRDARQELVGKVDKTLADQLRADAAGIPEFFPDSVGIAVDGTQRIPDQVRVELADFQQKAKQLEKLRAAGIIDEGDVRRTLARAKQETLGSLETTVQDGREDRDREPQFAAALEAGTREAFSAINQAVAGGRERDHEKQTAKHTQESVAVQEEMRRLLSRLERNSRKAPIKVARI